MLFEKWISKVCNKLVSDWSISFLQRSSMSSNQRGILQSYFTQDSIHTMILYSNRWVSFFTPYNFKDNTNLAVSSESNNEHLKKTFGRKYGEERSFKIRVYSFYWSSKFSCPLRTFKYFQNNLQYFLKRITRHDL